MPMVRGVAFDLEPVTSEVSEQYCQFLTSLRYTLDSAGFSNIRISAYIDAAMLVDPCDTHMFEAMTFPNNKIILPRADLGLEGDTPISPSEYKTLGTKLLQDFMISATDLKFKGSIGILLPAAGTESELSSLCTKDMQITRDFGLQQSQYVQIGIDLIDIALAHPDYLTI